MTSRLLFTGLARWVAVAWLIMLGWGEVWVFLRSRAVCEGKLQAVKVGPHGKLIAVVSDPQLTDAFSYGHSGLLLLLEEFYSDLFMRKAFRFVVRPSSPDKVIVNGDLFDGGKTLDDKDYSAHVKRFESIFGHVDKDHNANTWYVAGNHDVGLGKFTSREAEERYKQVFGSRMYSRQVCQHNIVVIDANSLTQNDFQHAPSFFFERLLVKRQDTLDFVQHTSKALHGPAILFSHIPLFRSPGVPCLENGDSYVRTSKPISPGGGRSYQSTLSQQVSSYLLEMLQPELILSGDDHDHCVVAHTIPGKKGLTAHEHTVATFSWLQGTRNQGLVFLQLSGCTEHEGAPPRVNKVVCDLPDQFAVYMIYLAVFVLSAILLVIESIVKSRHVLREVPQEHIYPYESVKQFHEDIESPDASATPLRYRQAAATLKGKEASSPTWTENHKNESQSETFTKLARLRPGSRCILGFVCAFRNVVVIVLPYYVIVNMLLLYV